MSKKIKSLIIGLGNIGLNYDVNKKRQILSHSKSLCQNPNYELIGGVDKNYSKIKKFTKIYKKPSYTSIEKALKELEPELIVISCNTEYHFKTFEKIKKCKSLKYLLLEKPGTYNFKNLNEIFSFFEKKKVKVYINYFRLFDNYYIDIASDIKKNKRLEIFVFYNRGIFNSCGHFLSFFNLFVKGYKKCKIIRTYKNINNDYEADLELTYKNAKIYFFRNNIKKLLNLKVIINGDRGNWTSLKNFNEFSFSKVCNDIHSKENKIYNNSKILVNKNFFVPQSVVYDKILKYRRKDINFYKENSINTLKILNNIIFNIKKF